MHSSSQAVRSLGILVIIALPFVAGCSGVKWENNYDTGMKRAVQQGRRALIQFHSMLDRDCLDMDNNVFSDPEVQKMMHNFVAIRLDPVMNKRLAEEWNVQTLPAFFVIRPDMTVAGSQVGKLEADKFRFFLFRGANY